MRRRLCVVFLFRFFHSFPLCVRLVFVVIFSHMKKKNTLHDSCRPLKKKKTFKKVPREKSNDPKSRQTGTKKENDIRSMAHKRSASRSHVLSSLDSVFISAIFLTLDLNHLIYKFSHTGIRLLSLFIKLFKYIYIYKEFIYTYIRKCAVDASLHLIDDDFSSKRFFFYHFFLFGLHLLWSSERMKENIIGK